MPKFHHFMLGVVVSVAAFLNIDKAAAQPTTPALFTDVAGLYVPEQQTKPKHILRERYVRLDQKLLKTLIKAVEIDNNGNLPDSHKVPKLMFNLFPNANYVSGEITAINDAVISGKLPNESGFFQIVVSEEVFSAHISSYRAPKGEFEVSSAGNDLYKIVQINPSKFSPD